MSAVAVRRLSCGHGLLSDSDRENPWMRANTRRSMPQLPAVRASARRSTRRAASPAPQSRRRATPKSSLTRKWRDRTSRPAGPDRDRRHPDRSCIVECPRSSAPSPRAPAPGIPTRDEMDIRPRVRRVRGRCVVGFYNFRRPHQAMNNQMPMAVWRAGMDKIEAAARAVDMPLRLDNANALPTYPQQRQKQQKAA
jgi:hypothetical protein